MSKFNSIIAVFVMSTICASPANARSVVDIGGVGMEAVYNGSVFSINEDNNYVFPGPPDFVGGTTIFASFDDTTSDQFGASGPADLGNGDFVLSGLTLVQDLSGGGLVLGVFNGGTVTLRDEIDNTLFTALIDLLVLSEVPGQNLLTGSGTYSSGVTTVAGADPLPSAGKIVNVTFNLSVNINDFTSPFTGLSSMDFVPEPVSLLGLLAAIPLIRRPRPRK